MARVVDNSQFESAQMNYTGTGKEGRKLQLVVRQCFQQQNHQ